MAFFTCTAPPLTVLVQSDKYVQKLEIGKNYTFTSTPLQKRKKKKHQ
jgi:hypothetical protein